MYADARMGGVGSTSRTGWSAVNAAGDTAGVGHTSQASLRAILDSAVRRQDAVSMEQLGVGPHRKPRTFASLYDVVARIMCTPTTDEAEEVDPTRPRYVSFDELLNTTHTIESPQSTDDHDVEQTEQTEQTERQTRCKRPRGGWMDGLKALRTYGHECVCSGQYCFCYVLKPNFTKHVKPVPRPLKLCPRFARTPLPDWPTASVEESSAASSSSIGRLKLSHLQPFLRDLALLYDDEEDEDEDEDEDK